MSLRQKLRLIAQSSRTILRSPGQSARELSSLPGRARGCDAAQLWDRIPHERPDGVGESAGRQVDASNPLRAYFDGIKEGPGVWKWLHYFEIYHRHLAKFIGRPVTVVEIGIFSGGSMPMWRNYFGAGCQVHGVDIQPECEVYENEHTRVHIGDQSDREFWKRFRDAVPEVDVLIDDGGHLPEQQMVSLEEMLPHLKSGGVYICEDITGIRNEFSEFMHSFADNLNAFDRSGKSQELHSMATPFQAAIHSVHLYPYVAVVEKRDVPIDSFVAPKHGTEWQPFRRM